MTHDTLVMLAKSAGLFWMIAMSVGIVIYVYWPSNKKPFDNAARSVIDEEDKPCR